MSYNASCGISGLKIKQGEEVRFVLLSKGSYDYLNSKQVPNAMLLTPTDFLAPISFPLKGTYNGEYGLSDIEEDVHTPLLKKRYNCSLETLVENAHCSRKLSDSYGIAHSISQSTKKDIDSEFDCFEEVLDYLGFEKGELANEYIHTEVPAYSFLLKEEQSIVIYSPKGEELISCLEANPTVLIGLIKEYAGICFDSFLERKIKTLEEELMAMTGMYIKEEIYQFMIDPNNELQSISRDHFDEEYAAFMSEVQEVEGQLSRLKRIFADGLMDEEIFSTMYPTIQPVSHYKFFSNAISHPFKNWPLFIDLHRLEIQRNLLSDKLFSETIFFYSMMGTNKSYIPTIADSRKNVNKRVGILASKVLELIK